MISSRLTALAFIALVSPLAIGATTTVGGSGSEGAVSH